MAPGGLVGLSFPGPSPIVQIWTTPGYYRVLRRRTGHITATLVSLPYHGLKNSWKLHEGLQARHPVSKIYSALHQMGWQGYRCSKEMRLKVFAYGAFLEHAICYQYFTSSTIHRQQRNMYKIASRWKNK